VIYEDKQAKADNVCFAPYDIDGDSRLDFAVGHDWQPNNSKSGGAIGWIQQSQDPQQPWKYHAIAEEPTTHRMQFIAFDPGAKPLLVVSPLKGRNTSPPDFNSAGVRQLAFQIPSDPANEKWPVTVINDDMHVTHNFCAVAWDQDPTPEILFVSFEGVHLLDRGSDGKWQRSHLGIGDQESKPNRGASEIKLGQLASGDRYIATIEPWHGDKVVVYTKPTAKESGSNQLWTRHVIDAELKWGHAVSCANLDADADDELIIGVRDDLDDKAADKRRGLRIYDPADKTGTKWNRQIVDPGSVAIEDLVVGDLNGDNRNDIVTVGRATHNVKVYWNEGR
jgi:hypothetical protein